MEEKIKEVQDYFKSKILAGEFELLSTDEWHCEIQIDKKYNFHFWMANEFYGFKQGRYSDESFMYLGVEKNKHIYSAINKVWKADRNIKSEAETEIAIKKLEERLKTLKQKQ